MPKLEIANVVSKKICMHSAFHSVGSGKAIRIQARRNWREVGGNNPRVPGEVSLTCSSSNETHVFLQETNEG